jgi:hypothetical protein
MTNFICNTCGTQFIVSQTPPEHCPICEDERQYIGFSGQQWTTQDDLRQTHRTIIKEQEKNLYGIGMEPSFAIGQRALLLQHPEGNILWDCIPLIDDESIKQVNALGGIAHIAISHPHFFTSCVEWAKAFDAQIHLHFEHQPWMMRPDARVHYWDGEGLTLASGVTLLRCGGHFPGSTVLHWAHGADHKGALFTGDTITVVADRRYVSFMYSYPNLIPLHSAAVEHIVKSLEPFSFDRLYGGWFDYVVKEDAKNVVVRSAERYINALSVKK